MVDVVTRARATRRRVKAVGAGHSFTAIAQADDVQVTLDGLQGLIAVDRQARTATLAAGTRLHQIPALLAPHGLAMTNLGDIDAQSIAGAISTGTHGTGARFGGIATQVIGAVLVTGTGEVLRVTSGEDGENAEGGENADLLPAVALGLGALGILTEVTLQCVDAFDLHATERVEPLEDVLASVHERAASADHLEFYWFPHTDLAMTKTNRRLPAGQRRDPLPAHRAWLDEVVMANGVFGATCALGRAAPVLVPRINRIAARLSGERTYTDASHRVFATRRTVRFSEMEYAIPAGEVVGALRAIRSLIEERGWRISFPLEVRFAAADDLWLSTAHGRDSAYIAVHRAQGEDPRPYFHAVEALLRARGGRPHWGKMHTRRAADLAPAYPRFADFQALREELDPDRVFANAYLRRVLGS
ncbi:FAD-linked oxidoreductase [Serinibacter salmoneus]|uniref:FAD-linked oxidoreductase n=1 Tax=Serinibacter salmoneus TaxID=556530 RepID=A0A2A9CVS1_9MICO|nr:FAD-linked oxidoreductase [Serinibacter salmoneus]